MKNKKWVYSFKQDSTQECLGLIEGILGQWVKFFFINVKWQKENPLEWFSSFTLTVEFI